MEIQQKTLYPQVKISWLHVKQIQHQQHKNKHYLSGTRICLLISAVQALSLQNSDSMYRSPLILTNMLHFPIFCLQFFCVYKSKSCALIPILIVPKFLFSFHPKTCIFRLNYCPRTRSLLLNRGDEKLCLKQRMQTPLLVSGQSSVFEITN